MQTQNKTFNIVLPALLARQAAVVAKSEYKSRSELMREALRIYLRDKAEWKELLAYGHQIGKKMGIKSEEDADRIFFEYRHGKNKNKK